jgi:threonyl-tRNA synthetase
MPDFDHHRLGRDLHLFASDEMLGAGLPLWLPAGAAVRQALERYIVDEERRAGFHHVYTPPLGRRELYERSGHWSHFADAMFPPMQLGGEEVVLRPMNCPHHIRVFSAERRSHRDLPVRLAELGMMFRNERSGVVGGLARVRCMTLNDAHIFCAPEHVGDEISNVLAMIQRAYDALGISVHRYRLSLRGAAAKFAAGDDVWERAVADLRAVLRARNIPFDEAPGEAAFYAPKIDVQVLDRRGHEETLSTIQLDYVLPVRFGLRYDRSDGGQAVPVLIHRSVVSTMERMVAHLVEVHGANLPAWIAPVQVRVLPVGEEQHDAAAGLARVLREADVRVDVEARDSLPVRVRAASVARVPYVVILGAREAGSGRVAVRDRDGNRAEYHRDAFIDHVRAAVQPAAALR